MKLILNQMAFFVVFMALLLLEIGLIALFAWRFNFTDLWALAPIYVFLGFSLLLSAIRIIFDMAGNYFKTRLQLLLTIIRTLSLAAIIAAAVYVQTSWLIGIAVVVIGCILGISLAFFYTEWSMKIYFMVQEKKAKRRDDELFKRHKAEVDGALRLI